MPAASKISFDLISEELVFADNGLYANGSSRP